MTGDMMSTQQNNAEAADGHSFADKIGQLVSAKYQALFGTTTYSKRRVMSGVVMTRYDGNMVLQCTLVIVNAWIVNNLSLVNIFGETGRFFCNINYMLNSEHLSLVNKIGDKTEFTITRVLCIWIFISLKVKVMGSNPGYLLKSFLLYLNNQ